MALVSGPGFALPIRRTLFICLGALAFAQPDRGELDGKPVLGIRVEGLRRTETEIVLNQLVSREGGLFSESNRRRDELLLDRLGIFSSIRVSPVLQGEGVVLVVQLRETLPVAPYLSATSTQENGLSAGPGIGAINLAGRAFNANLAVEFGGATNVYFRLRSPRLARPSWQYEAGLARVQRDNPVFHFSEFSQQVEGKLGYQATPDVQIAARVRLLSLRSDQPGTTISPSGRDRIPSLAFELRFDGRDSWSDPANGWYIGFDGVRSGVSSGGWWTAQLDARRHQRIRGRHAAAAFSLISLQSGVPGVDLPVYMTYGIGGANSVRGWNTGARIGKNQWLNTLEYRYRLVKLRPTRFFRYNIYWGIHLALYGDLGTAWTAAPDFTRNFIGGAGYGVRLVIPYVGMVRFDRAYGNALRPCYGLGERADVWRDRIR